MCVSLYYVAWTIEFQKEGALKLSVAIFFSFFNPKKYKYKTSGIESHLVMFTQCGINWAGPRFNGKMQGARAYTDFLYALLKFDCTLKQVLNSSLRKDILPMMF